MGIVAGACLLLLMATTAIHYEVLRLLSAVLQVPTPQPRLKLVLVIVGAFGAHALEILLYGGSYYSLANWFDANDLYQLDLEQSLYFSAEAYTSLGTSDIHPHGHLRLLAGMEALNGLLLLGWTTSYTYISMERFWDAHGKRKSSKPHAPKPADMRAPKVTEIREYTRELDRH